MTKLYNEMNKCFKIKEFAKTNRKFKYVIRANVFKNYC